MTEPSCIMAAEMARVTGTARRRWTASDDELLARRRASGMLLADIAELLDRTEAATAKRVESLVKAGLAAAMSPSDRSRRAGLVALSTRGDLWTDEEDATLIDCWRSGVTAREAARILGRPHGSTEGRIHKLRQSGGIQPLTRAERSQREHRVRAVRSATEYAAGVAILDATPNTWDLGYVVGVLNGDGFIHRSRLSACMKTTNKSFADGFARALVATFGRGIKRLTRVEPRKEIGDYVYRNVTYFEVYMHQRHLVQAIISRFGPFGSHGWRINADACVARGTEFADGLLQGFFDSEGSVAATGMSIRVSSVHEDGMKDLLSLLTLRGYDATISARSKRGEFRIGLRVHSAERFAREIGSRIDTKAQRMRAALRRRKR